MIDGVKVVPLRKICDERGNILHMLREDDPHFNRFGEIYFSTIYPGVVKGWHIHSRMTLNYAVVSGMVKLVLYDDREDSISRGEIVELFVGDHNYQLVVVPPLVWNGFKGIGMGEAIVANCSTIAHDPSEIGRKPPGDAGIPYDWTRNDG